MTEPLSAEELDALQRLAEGATPGPWRWFYEDDSMPAILGNDDYAADGHVLSAFVCDSCQKTGNRCLCPNEANAAYIAAANPATLLRLLAQVKELQERDEQQRRDGTVLCSPSYIAVVDKERAELLQARAALAAALSQVREAEWQDYEKLRRATLVILRGFDEGVFVRSIDGDQRPDWAIRLLPFVAALGESKSIVGDPCLGEDCPIHGGPNSEGQT